jgi:hypothetical protein
MPQLKELTHLVFLAAVTTFISCSDDENPQVRGVLIDIFTEEPYPNKWVVIKAGSKVETDGNVLYLKDEVKDSVLTNSEGQFLFNVRPSKKYYSLHINDESLITTRKLPYRFDYSAITSRPDTLLAGSHTTLTFQITHEDLNNGKTLSLETTCKIPRLGLFFSNYSFSVPPESVNFTHTVKLFWDYNKEVTVTKVISSLPNEPTTESQLLVLDKSGTKTIDISY